MLCVGVLAVSDDVVYTDAFAEWMSGGMESGGELLKFMPECTAAGAKSWKNRGLSLLASSEHTRISELGEGSSKVFGRNCGAQWCRTL